MENLQRETDTSAPLLDGALSFDEGEVPWALDVAEVFSSLSTSQDGLATETATERREAFGPNQLREQERKSALMILWEQVRSLIMLLLLVAMAVSFVTSQHIEALAIAAVIVLNSLIGFFTELRAVRSMEALQRLGQAEATVKRDGELSRVAASELVPGDVVHLAVGDVVPADLRITNVDDLEVDESALTGESTPIEKSSEPVDEETDLPDRSSMAWKGTVVNRGSGQGLVVATGMDTELGAISAMVETAESGQTPLERRLDRLGQRLVWLTLGVAAVVILVGVVAGRDLRLMLQTGIALAVAAIPEGLPIVATIALAHGMRQMLRRNALIRRLSSVETLGATTLICSDKTGTLTENKMTVTTIALSSSDAELADDDEALRAALEDNAELRAALETAVLANEVTDETGEEEEEPRQGDPMEHALLDLGRRADRRRSDLLRSRPAVHLVPFEREAKMMATVHEDEEGEKFLVAVKGAPEAVLAVSSQVLRGDRQEPLEQEERQRWTEKVEELAAGGLRVLAVARRRVSSAEEDVVVEKTFEELCLLGLVGLLDPLREEVLDSLDRCREAGIRVAMVTGDHPETARTIARDAALFEGSGREEVVEGREFPSPEDLDDETRERVLSAAAFARVTPKQKLDLVDLHQEAGEVVAMTGDGVNDAPALRSADIGVAMGQRGTDVARQAADMVLEDDRFPTIVAAVERGRVIFDNIRRFVIYLLSGNVGEILAVGAATAIGAPMPLLPLQILYLNMLNDVFPALALGVGSGEGEVMRRPPRDPKEPVVARYHWALIGGYGLLIGAVVLGAFGAALVWLELGLERAVTVSFLSLSIGRLLHAFNMRSPGSGLLNNEVTKNPWVWGALALCVALLLAAVYLPPLAQVLGVTPPGLSGWAVVASASLLILLVGQLALMVIHRLRAG